MKVVITYDKEGNVNYAVYNDKWCVIKKEETIIKDYVEGECTLNDIIVTNYKTYQDGTVVYYDVLNGIPCTNYHVDNSITGYNGIYTGDNKIATTDNQNSCLKFYTFNDDEGDTILNLLLDHNTTAVTY